MADAPLAAKMADTVDLDGEEQDDDAPDVPEGKVEPMAKSRAALEALVRDLEARTGYVAPSAASVASSAPTPAGASASKVKKGEKDPWANVVVQVGRIVEVEKHASAEKLYVCQVDVGKAKEGTPTVRQLVSAIVPSYPDAKELQGRLIAVITNLKAAKLKGKDSVVMLLAATLPDAKARLVDVPANSEPGDRVLAHGVDSAAEPPKVLSDKNLAAVLAGLRVRDGKATYYDHVLATSRGPLVVPGAADGTIIK